MIHLQIYEDGECKKSISVEGELVCGRQDPKQGDPDPIAIYERDGCKRLVLIPADEKKFSRRWFSLSCDDEGRIIVRNLHLSHEIKLKDGQEIGAGDSKSFDGQVAINLGEARHMRVETDAVQQFRVLDSIPLVPGHEQDVDATLTVGQFAETEGKAVVDLLKIALKVIQQSSGSDAFFQAAADAATAIVGLDRATILLRDKSRSTGPASEMETFRWSTVAEFRRPGPESEDTPAISRTILKQVATDGRTQIHDPENRSFEVAESAISVHSIVASPILDTDRHVIGVLYGDRWRGRSAGGNRCITDLEGTLIEVLAGALASGIARQEEARLRNHLADFFSPRVANLLATRPELLRGQDAVVTVLFCDVRGFSSVTEQLGPQKTIEWINDVLTELSHCVVDRDGVLVDYVGDELMAMWGAPDEQPDHAQRAVDAAVAMLEGIEALRLRWSDRLPQRFGAGIGINTGDARVGNVGSELKFKYGVLGNTVNGGSRLQAATKQLGVDCLASAQTVSVANCRQRARRLAKLQVVGIEQPIDVFEITAQPDANWVQLREDYESALADFETLQFAEATGKLASLIQKYPADRPSRLLLTRAVTQIDQPETDFRPEWKLTRK